MRQPRAPWKWLRFSGQSRVNTRKRLSLERTFLLVVSVVPGGFLVVFFLTKVLAEQKIASAWLFYEKIKGGVERSERAAAAAAAEVFAGWDSGYFKSPFITLLKERCSL